MGRGTDLQIWTTVNDALSCCTVMACEDLWNLGKLGKLGKLVGEDSPEVSWREACEDLEIRGSW